MKLIFIVSRSVTVDRIEGQVRAGDFPLVLGGDCSITPWRG
ncbi:hypothetical protein [Streptomyces sp. NPDC093568]